MSYKLGDLVHVRGSSKGGHRVHVVVAEPNARGFAETSLSSASRWFSPQVVNVEFLSPADEAAKETRRVRRVLAKLKPDPDGWTRIVVGKGYKQKKLQQRAIKPPSW